MTTPHPVSPKGSEDVSTSIFFDADILIGQSKTERELQARKLSFFCSRKRVELLTTDLTRIQVAKHCAERACNQLKCLSNEKTAKLARDLFSERIPRIDKEHMYQTAYDYYLNEITVATSGRHWRRVAYSDGIVPKVFVEYGKKRGFFRDQAKKGQFIDAIVFEMLRAEATHQTLVIIFSRDKDFSAVDEYDDNIKHLKSWSELIDALGIREDIPQADDLVREYQDSIVEKVHHHLWKVWNDGTEELGYVQDVMPEIEVRRVQARSTGGVILEEQFMIIGEMEVAFDLPKDIPIVMAPSWSRDTITDPRERADATCDVTFAMMGLRAGEKYNVDWLEIEFGGGGIAYVMI